MPKQVKGDEIVALGPSVLLDRHSCCPCTGAPLRRSYRDTRSFSAALCDPIAPRRTPLTCRRGRTYQEHMGSINRDRVPMGHRRRRSETVADIIIRDRWEVISWCQVCGLSMVLDLALVARISGPQTSLWNRKARCRRIACPGFVEFNGKAPEMSGYKPLAAPNPR
jgi:hypothetical protein